MRKNFYECVKLLRVLLAKHNYGGFSIKMKNSKEVLMIIPDSCSEIHGINDISYFIVDGPHLSFSVDTVEQLAEKLLNYQELIKQEEQRKQRWITLLNKCKTKLENLDKDSLEYEKQKALYLDFYQDVHGYCYK